MADESGNRTARILAALALASALAPLNSTMLSVAIPAIGRALGREGPTLTHALVTSYLVASIVMQSPGGKLGDRLGYRRTLALGQGLFLAGSMLAGAIEALAPLVISRVMMAAGGGLIVPSATALLRVEIPEARRGRAFGMFGATMALAATLGPIVGGTLTAHFGYRAVFLANVPLLLLSAWLARGGHDEAPSTAVAPRARFDFLGSALLALSLGALAIGTRLHGAARPGAMALGAAVLLAFVAHERRVSDPVVDLGLLRVRAIAASGGLIALHNLGMYALLFTLPAVLERRFAMTAASTGRTIVPMMVAMVAAGPVAGRLVDRLGARRLAVLGSLTALGAMLWMRSLPLLRAAEVIGPLVLLGVGLGAASAPAQASAMGAAPREKSGMAAGMLSTLRYLGGVAGIVVLGAVSAGYEGDARAMLRRATTAFAVSLGLAVLAAAALPGHAAAPRRGERTPSGG